MLFSSSTIFFLPKDIFVDQRYFSSSKIFSADTALWPSGPLRDLSWQPKRWSDVYISAKHLPPCQPVHHHTVQNTLCAKLSAKCKRQYSGKHSVCKVCCDEIGVPEKQPADELVEFFGRKSVRVKIWPAAELRNVTDKTDLSV